jgi:hypothetical protein
VLEYVVDCREQQMLVVEQEQQLEQLFEQALPKSIKEKKKINHKSK